MKNLIFLLFLSQSAICQSSLEPLVLDQKWMDKIENLAPSEPTVIPTKSENVLLFSKFTGFQHWVIPFNDELVKILSKKTRAFTVDQTVEISPFEKSNIKKYDAIILNNNCSKGDNRNLFFDVLSENPELSEKKKWRLAKKYEKNLRNYVKKGGGLVVLHGAIVMQNKSKEYGEMLGGSFDYHPVQQNINVDLVDPNHPLVAAFKGKGFSHIDEPYFFNNDYFNYNFRPLLSMKTDQLVKLKTPVSDPVKYISWVKKYGKGRIFYSSPSHNAQSYDNPDLLKFILDGIQYATGDLKVDDSPMKN